MTGSSSLDIAYARDRAAFEEDEALPPKRTAIDRRTDQFIRALLIIYAILAVSCWVCFHFMQRR